MINGTMASEKTISTSKICAHIVHIIVYRLDSKCAGTLHQKACQNSQLIEQVMLRHQYAEPLCHSVRIRHVVFNRNTRQKQTINAANQRLRQVQSLTNQSTLRRADSKNIAVKWKHELRTIQHRTQETSKIHTKESSCKRSRKRSKHSF